MMIGTFTINHFGNKLQYNVICTAFIGLFGLGSTSLISGFLPKSDVAFSLLNSIISLPMPLGLLVAGPVSGCESVVYNVICQIRKKLKNPDMTQTVIRRGYKFVG